MPGSRVPRGCCATTWRRSTTGSGCRTTHDVRTTPWLRSMLYPRGGGNVFGLRAKCKAAYLRKGYADSQIDAVHRGWWTRATTTPPPVSSSPPTAGRSRRCHPMPRPPRNGTRSSRRSSRHLDRRRGGRPAHRLDPRVLSGRLRATRVASRSRRDQRRLLHQLPGHRPGGSALEHLRHALAHPVLQGQTTLGCNGRRRVGIRGTSSGTACRSGRGLIRSRTRPRETCAGTAASTRRCRGRARSPRDEAEWAPSPATASGREQRSRSPRSRGGNRNPTPARALRFQRFQRF